MKKTFMVLGIIGTSILLTQCTAKKTAKSDMSASDVVAEVKKNYTQAQMDEGKTIWQSHCNKCHKLHDGPDHTVAKWEKVLPVMTNKAKLNAEDAGKVRAYLIANAKMN